MPIARLLSHDLDEEMNLGRVIRGGEARPRKC